MEEIYKPIKENPRYLVSNLGNVRHLDYSYDDNHYYQMTPSKNKKKGYLAVTISKNGKSKKFLVHRLVAEAFIPNPENKPQVNHKNGIHTDNRVSNLEWVTMEENIEHSIKNGLQFKHLNKI